MKMSWMIMTLKIQQLFYQYEQQKNKPIELFVLKDNSVKQKEK